MTSSGHGYSNIDINLERSGWSVEAKIMEAMMREHHEETQSSSLEGTRGSDSVHAPVVVPAWVTWFRSMGSATAGSQEDSTQPENSSSRRGRSEEDTSMRPSVSRKRDTIIHFWFPRRLSDRRPVLQEEDGIRESDPSSCTSCMKL